jgi:hypothetical protein
MQCNVEFGYQLSICSGTKENHGKPWSSWQVAGPSGCKLTSSRSRSYFTTDKSVSQSVSMSWYRAPLWDLRPDIISCRKVAVWILSVSQYVLVSSTLVGLATRYYFLSECCCLNFVSQWVSMSWYRVPLWDLRPDITSCRNVAVWNLWSHIYWEPSLTIGRVCNLQCNHSIVRVAQNP